MPYVMGGLAAVFVGVVARIVHLVREHKRKKGARGHSAPRRGSRSYFCLRRPLFFQQRQGGVPRPGAGHVLLLPPAASFLSAAKEKRKRNAAKNYVFGFPYAASPDFSLVEISHANVVPWKLHRNIALSLLLGALPLLL